MMAGYALKRAILIMMIASVCYGPARASNYKTNYYSIRPGMTPQELEMHSIKPSHAYCKKDGDKETVWRRDGKYQFEYDQRGILTNTTWFSRNKFAYTSDEEFKYMARDSICLRGKKFRFDRFNIGIYRDLNIVYRRKVMFAVHENDYPIHYALMPDIENGRGYFLYCEKRGKINLNLTADICAISEVVCPHKKSHGGVMGGGSRF